MELSVLIPTFRRPEKIARCVALLATQSLDAAEYEVLVGLDGPDAASAAASEGAWIAAGGRSGHLSVVGCERIGLAGVRNRLLPLARGLTMVSLNDDVLPGLGFLEAHAVEHRSRRAGTEGGEGVIVSGASPWVVHEPDRLFDRLLRASPMVFFYDAMDAPASRADPDRDWGFRHAWGLNMSAPMSCVRELGGFSVFPAKYGYEDIELAFRVQERWGSPVLYRPGALAPHDHRMEPAGYLEREYRLGYAAWGFALASPACAAAVFGRDVAAAEEVAYSREFVQRERGAAERLAPGFAALADRPAAAADGAEGPLLLRALYEAHLPLKRFHWRRGHLAGAEGWPLEQGGPLDEQTEVSRGTPTVPAPWTDPPSA